MAGATVKIGIEKLPIPESEQGALGIIETFNQHLAMDIGICQHYVLTIFLVLTARTARLKYHQESEAVPLLTS